jgi:hypothetical protein
MYSFYAKTNLIHQVAGFGIEGLMFSEGFTYSVVLCGFSVELCVIAFLKISFFWAL